MPHTLRERLNWLDRAEIVAILEGYGFQCYDRETTDELRDAIVANVEDGTMDPDDLAALHPNVLGG